MDRGRDKPITQAQRAAKPGESRLPNFSASCCSGPSHVNPLRIGKYEYRARAALPRARTTGGTFELEIDKFEVRIAVLMPIVSVRPFSRTKF